MSTDPSQSKRGPKKPPPSWIKNPKKRALRVLKRGARPALNRYLARHSLVGDPIRFEPGTFGWESDLRDQWQAIRDEMENVLRLRDHIPAFQEISPDQQRITQGGQWKTFWLRGFGLRSEHCSDLCPVTDTVLDQIPGVVTAFFSIMSPGAHVVAHRGVTKGMINCHLGLRVPEKRENCHIRVGTEDFHWEEGALEIFDDTHKHEVWNETQDDRIILMIQFERPLRDPGRQVRDLFLRGLRLTPYVRRARANQQQFDQQLKDLKKNLEDRSRSNLDQKEQMEPRQGGTTLALERANRLKCQRRDAGRGTQTLQTPHTSRRCLRLPERSEWPETHGSGSVL